jgi:hypothetical protein
MDALLTHREGFPACEGSLMLCPVCDFACTHLVSCTVNQLGEVTTVRETGTTIDEIPEPDYPHRGSSIAIEAYCDSGHRFTLELRFHKGSVLVQTTRLADCSAHPVEGFISPAGLRRT